MQVTLLSLLPLKTQHIPQSAFLAISDNLNVGIVKCWTINMDCFLKLYFFFFFCMKFQGGYIGRTCLSLIIFSLSISTLLVLELCVIYLVVQDYEACEEHLLRDCEFLAMLACGPALCKRKLWHPDNGKQGLFQEFHFAVLASVHL